MHQSMHKSVRFKIDPRMIPAEKVARRLGITKANFEAKRLELEQAGFPKADPIIGTYSLLAVDGWIDRRHGSAMDLERMAAQAEMLEAVRHAPWTKRGTLQKSGAFDVKGGKPVRGQK